MDIIIVHDRLSAHPSHDEMDTIQEVNHVRRALHQLGYQVHTSTFTLNLPLMERRLRESGAHMIFNLVETQKGSRLLFVAPALFESLGMDYTGGSSVGMMLSSDKLEAKRLMTTSGIPTPEWASSGDRKCLESLIRYPVIIKPVAEEASVGINDDSVIQKPSMTLIEQLLEDKKKDIFVERYVEGREFNISILPIDGKPTVLPPAEMIFSDFPQGKPRITGYKAKWDEQSWEYRHTNRTFEIQHLDRSNVDEVVQVSIACWELFGAKGYVRVDLRLDSENRPYVLEVNLNPCITADSGFVAAAQAYGLSYTALIDRIIRG